MAAWSAEKQAAPPAPEMPVELSQRAMDLFPEFFCLCDDNEGKSCGLNLGYCVCGKNPGEHKMKVFIQSLVDLGKSTNQIRTAMVARYGEAVKFSK